MSVKVADLIADTTWSPPRSGNRARVSILLPVYRRNADGTLARCIESILSQTFADFELIVIDDASTDGSADTVARFMSEDARIGCLTHPRNIGLPAVSEFEAFEKATGDFILCAFDDFVYEPDALEKLLDFAVANPGVVPHGYAELMLSEGGQARLGYRPSHDALLITNFIANASVLIPRSVIDDVGFYDPHILSARLCDWDLLRRIHRSYRLAFVDVLVGREFGMARPDSLGRTYPIYSDASDLYFSSDRNARLLPSRLRDFDVWSVPAGSLASVELAIDATRDYYAAKWWVPTVPSISGATGIGRSLLVCSELNASTMLVFEGLACREGLSITHIRERSIKPEMDQLLGSVDAVVMVRQLFGPYEQAIMSSCRRWGVPLLYYVDDNLIALNETTDDYPEFSVDAVRAAVSDFAGIVTASDALKDDMVERGVHDNVVVIRPTFSDARAAKCRRIRGADRVSSRLRIGFFGGRERFDSFANSVVPALVERLGSEAFELFVREGAGVGLTGVAVTDVDESESYDKFLEHWSALGLDVLLHTPVDSANTPYKSDGTLLIAAYIGAVPILADEPAFARHRGSPALFAASAEDFADQVFALMDGKVRRQIHDSLVGYARTAFDPAQGERALQQVMANIPVVTPGVIWRRLRGRIGADGGSGVVAMGGRAFRIALWLQDLGAKLRPYGIMRLVRLLDRNG